MFKTKALKSLFIVTVNVLHLLIQIILLFYLKKFAFTMLQTEIVLKS